MQTERLEKYAEENGFEIVRAFIDIEMANSAYERGSLTPHYRTPVRPAGAWERNDDWPGVRDGLRNWFLGQAV